MPIWDTMKMANDTICKQKSYIEFCKENGYMTNHAVPQVRKTAEILWRYITGNQAFEEEHTGLADVTIEAQILRKGICNPFLFPYFRHVTARRPKLVLTNHP